MCTLYTIAQIKENIFGNPMYQMKLSVFRRLYTLSILGYNYRLRSNITYREIKLRFLKCVLERTVYYPLLNKVCICK